MTRERRRCFVHIGAPKTGTTFLQKVFFDNREALAAEGLLYPDVSLRGYGHHDLAFLLAGGYPEWATPAERTLSELQTDLAAQAKVARADLLLSSEDFYLCPAPQALHDLLNVTGCLNGREPVVIVYLRRQDDAHESWYNQTIKAQGYVHGIDESIERFHELWDYRKHLAEWEAVFGRDALVVRTYETASFQGGSLLRDMAEVLSLAPDLLAAPTDYVNTSLNRDLLEVQRYINGLDLTPVRKRRFHRDLMVLSQAARGTGIFDEQPVIDSQRRAAVLESYAQSNSAVAHRYFGRERLFLDAQPPQASTPAKREGLTVEKVLHVLGWLAARET